MTLSRRNSRRITVDGEVYRWVASQDSGYVVLVVQHETANAKKLEIIVSKDEGVVLEKGSYSVEYGGVAELILTPKTVETLIRRSVALGWNPKDKGPPVELSLSPDGLAVRRGL